MRSQEEPGGARGSQEEPGGAGGARMSQEDPGGPRRSQRMVTSLLITSLASDQRDRECCVWVLEILVSQRHSTTCESCFGQKCWHKVT